MTITSTFCLAYGGLAIAKRHDEVTGRLLVAKCSKVFFFFFFLGYRGIVHPPSADEGTERT